MVKSNQSGQTKYALTVVGLLLGGGQVLVIRRALALGGGDELVFSLSLAFWLLFVALGGALGAQLERRLMMPIRPFALALLLLSLAVPASLVLLPIMASSFGLIPGTVPGGGGMVFSLAIALLPLGLAGGVCFPLGFGLLKTATPKPVSLAYMFEAFGAFIGGMIVSLIFLPHFGGLTFSCLLMFLGIGAGLGLYLPRRYVGLGIGLCLLLGLALIPSAKKTESKLLASLRPGMELLDYRETPYGLVEITRRAGQVTIYENGLILALFDDPAGAEERSHLALALHPAPRSVLWIGGSLGGALPEALRHPSIERLDLVELNPDLYRAADWLGPLYRQVLQDARVHPYTDDGRSFLRRVPPQSYDLIELNLPGPRTARLSKFYSREGFRLARRALKPGGVLAFSLESAEDYIGSDLASLLASISTTLKTEFPRVEILPGERAIFVAGNDSAMNTIVADSLSDQLSRRGIEPVYWNKFRLQDRFSVSRRETLKQALMQAKSVKINRDGAPICFYQQQVFWSWQVRGGLPLMMKALGNIFGLASMITLAAMLIGVLIVRRFFTRTRMKIGIYWTVMAVGFAGMALEILAIIAFQVQFGSGYREIGLLVGCYMAGLALGALWMTRRREETVHLFLRVQFFWMIIPVGIILLAFPGNGLLVSPAFGRIMFWAYMLGLGVLGGLHFSLAAQISSTLRSHPGLLYALDLLGAAMGALLIGLLAVPLAGIMFSALGLVVLNLAPLILLVGKSARL